MSLRDYLSLQFKNKSCVTIDDIYLQCGLDREVQADQRRVSKAIRQECRLRDNHFLPSHYSIRRGKDIIIELLEE